MSLNKNFKNDIIIKNHKMLTFVEIIEKFFISTQMKNIIS